jgi:hypothetical protein
MISVTKTSNSAKSQPVCWLAQQNLKEKEKTKNQEERGTEKTKEREKGKKWDCTFHSQLDSN